MENERFNIAVSYASEQRPYVERFVNKLHAYKLNVYYDRNEQAKMVGKILDQELHRIYLSKSDHCVLFLSNDYIEKPITKYESQIILSETLYRDGFMYIFKFQDVTIPGLNRNFIYSSLNDFSEPEQYADFIYEVIKGERPGGSEKDFLYQTLSNGIEGMLNRLAAPYGLTLWKENPPNQLLIEVRAGFSVRLQVQIGKVPGKKGVCLWLHRGRNSCDEHAYHGYVEWRPDACCYQLNNYGLFFELTPELRFSSTEDLMQRIEAEILMLFGS